MKNIKRIVTAVALMLVLLPSYSQEKTDSVYEFRFVSGKDQFYSPYKDNETELNRLMKCIELHKESIKQEKIHVDGYCNSQSTTKARLNTAKTRSNRVKSHMITHAGLTEDSFVTKNHADGGDYVTVRLYVPAAVAVKVEEDVQKPTVVDVAVTEKNVSADTAPSADLQSAESSSVLADLQSASLRANLLRWATLTPDLGIEWQFASQWSVAVDGSWTSWSWDNRNRRYALWEVSPEVRYYLAESNKFYLGAQYKVGEFNYKLGCTGKQGDLQGGGITFGYKLPIGKRLALDFNAAAGCLHTSYESYHVADGVRVKECDRSKNVWGVTDLGVTLVWIIK